MPDLDDILLHKCKCQKPSVKFHPLTEGGYCCLECYLKAVLLFNTRNGNRCDICHELLHELNCINRYCKTNNKSFPTSFRP